LSVLSEIRALPGVIRHLTAAIQAITEVHRSTAPANERLEELERSRTLWEAEMEALLVKADSTYKSASNAESRARTMERRNEKLADPFAEDGEALEEAAPRGYEPTSEEERMLDLPLALARPLGKTNALRSKFMI